MLPGKEYFNKLSEIRSKLGPAVKPTLSECEQEFDRLNADNSFYWVFNLKQDRITFRKGIETYLGYPEKGEYSSRKISSWTPQLRSKVFHAQILAAYVETFEYVRQDDILEGLIQFSINRVFINKNGEYVYTVQNSKPFRVDKNGKMVSNLSWFHVREPFDLTDNLGGTFLVNKALKKKSKDNVDKIIRLFNELKINFIEDYPFTLREQEVLTYFITYQKSELTLRKKEELIAKKIGVSARTIEGIRQSAEKNGEEFLGTKFSSFDYFLDVIRKAKLV